MSIVNPAADTAIVNTSAKVLVAPFACADNKKIAHGAISNRRAMAYFANIKLVYWRAVPAKNGWVRPSLLGFLFRGWAAQGSDLRIIQ